jgi:hypothetical protein
VKRTALVASAESWGLTWGVLARWRVELLWPYLQLQALPAGALWVSGKRDTLGTNR